MHPTTRCLAKSFWGRSLDELKRYSHIIYHQETIKGVTGPKPLHDFHTPDKIDDCKIMCDSGFDGFSRAALDHVPETTKTTTDGASTTTIPAHARFHGTISTALPAHRPEVTRSGFAAWRTRDLKPTVFGRLLWDVDMYAYLALRVRSDGRSYFVNVQTDGVVPEDLHQHRLFVKRPGEWETVLIKWNDFVRTNHGLPIEPQRGLLRQRVKSVGVGLTDRVPGPFDISIERLWATNDVFEIHADKAPLPEGKLKTKEGKAIRWDD